MGCCTVDTGEGRRVRAAGTERDHREDAKDAKKTGMNHEIHETHERQTLACARLGAAIF
jgi:hypothetical protein